MSRRFLFLQGPVGPFFRMLGASLQRDGHAVYRINLNGSDLFDWPRGDLFRGTGEAWPAFVCQYAASRGITDLVLFGDCRCWHRLAMDALREWNGALRIHVMEEGYIRPDWITVELDGVNGHSALHELRGRFGEAPEAIKAPAEPLPTGESPFAMGVRATLSYLALFFASPFFPHYQHHRPLRPSQEAGAWLKKLATRMAAKRRARAVQSALFEGWRHYFLVLLQIDADKQVQEHSPIRSMSELLEVIVPSFARYSPHGTLLAVKAHPLDPDSRRHRARAEALARSYGVADRVVFLDGGELGSLVSSARGCITINSTSGISVLHRGKSLHAFGKAVYGGVGLTHQGSIDEFWGAAQAPEPAHYEAFRRVVIARSQVNGNFYTKKGMTMAIDQVVRRLGGAPMMYGMDLASRQVEQTCHDEAVSA